MRCPSCSSVAAIFFSLLHDLCPTLFLLLQHRFPRSNVRSFSPLAQNLSLFSIFLRFYPVIYKELFLLPPNPRREPL